MMTDILVITLMTDFLVINDGEGGWAMATAMAIVKAVGNHRSESGW